MPLRPPRILHCHSTFSLGGKEARAARLMNAFGAWAHHVILSAVPDALGARAAIDAAIHVDFPGDAAPALHGKPGPMRYLALARYMQGFDLILSYNWGSMDAVMAHRLFARGMRLPPLIHHEDGFNADEAARRNPKRNIFRRLALPTAHALVVPSHMLGDIAMREWHAGDRLRHISNGIDTADYAAPPVADAVPGFTRQRDEIIIGSLAGLRAVKDLPLLVDAVALAAKQSGLPLRLIIVGEGEERANILAKAAETGFADRLLLPGFLPDPARYVGHFDILALSSLSEQQPISVMEGMAAARPIVAPMVGDVAQMVAAENAPFICADRSIAALAAAIVALARDADLRRTIGDANARRARACFDADDMIARYQALYADALGRAF
ncbi:MAG: glycosyltransferase [Sphingomonadaceae bacterium]|nr:glycosyltransferase [Sphingomonadaceae bacterium]